MGRGFRLGATLVAVAAFLLPFVPAAATSARSAAGMNTSRDSGIEAGLPANAASGAKQSALIDSVSCSSQGNCSAVGHYQDSAGNQEGLLLTETAGAWAAGSEAVLPPNAATDGTQSVSLNSISCPAPGNCSAVGTYSDSTGGVWGLLLTETAGTWAPGAEAVLPANAAADGIQSVSLSSISCPSPGNCSAVGGYVATTSSAPFASQGLLLAETAGSWSAGAEAALPSDAATGYGVNVSLDAVSCPSQGNCSAVGYYNDSAGNGDGLLLTETAGRWATGVQATLPANAVPLHQSVSINAVACVSAGSCSAAGTYLDRAGADQGLLLSETAGGWAAGVEAALPAGAATTFQAVVPSAVACSSAGNCTVVGTYFDRSNNIQGLLLDEKANRWAAGIEAALPANAATNQQSVLLNSVSCVSAGYCAAVGRYFDRSGNGQGLLLTQAGRNWASAVETGPPWGAYLASVSCPSGPSHSCSGVGSYRAGSGGVQGLLTSITVDLTPQPCLVPQLKGETLVAAGRSLSAHHCSLGMVTHATSRTIRKGRVISQQPMPGRRRPHRTRVNLVVSRGP